MSTEITPGLSIIGASVPFVSEGTPAGRKPPLTSGVNIKPADKGAYDESSLLIAHTNCQTDSADKKSTPLKGYHIVQSVPTLSLFPPEQPPEIETEITINLTENELKIISEPSFGL